LVQKEQGASREPLSGARVFAPPASGLLSRGQCRVSLCGIVLEWRISAYGFRLDTASTNPARLTAFNETFLMLAVVCALALVAAWRLREAPSTGT